ncbi:unnamed protein product [Anisakis simplex]|uniref:F-box domain-containing protein n=1 Tax=Anisakis simplex TaxID=6269 RepID=A0A0M3K0G9_ANISI|nr:unnamed protein product [Anisakis simplex]
MPKRPYDTDDTEVIGEVIPKKMFSCGEIAAQTKLLPFASKYQFIDKRYRFKKSGDDFVTIATLTNLRTLQIDVSMYATPDEFMQLKSLNNLEHIHLEWSCCQNLKAEHLTRLFELPSENASSCFPYRLKYLRLWNCPELLQMVAVKAIISRNLNFLNISCLYKMRCDALYELADDDLPKLQFLILHDTEIDQKFLENLNLKHPKLMISNRRKHFINWDLKDGKQPCFNEEFAGDLNTILNDLSELYGFCCMHSVI